MLFILFEMMEENNEIVFECKGLGKYIISYKSTVLDSELNKVEDNNTLEPEDTVEKKSNIVVYTVLVGVAIAMGGTIYFVIKKKNS